MIMTMCYELAYDQVNLNCLCLRSKKKGRKEGK